MVNFDASREWVIILPSDVPQAKRAAEDLSRYIGLLAGLNGNQSPKKPRISDALTPAPPGAVILLGSGGSGPERNGFSWRAVPERVEISGESGRGLCNGIYSFLAALGICWPAPGKEILPTLPADKSADFPLAICSAAEASGYNGNNPAEAPWRRFAAARGKTVKRILKKNQVFAEWAARRRYDAIIFPLAVFASAAAGRRLKQLKQFSGEYGIALEAGGWDLSSLVPRSYFFFHRDFFRMEEGRRKKLYHFCPTSPGAIRLIGKEGKKLFRLAGETNVFHLWPDKGAETTWCSCPSCRAFTPSEQNRIAVNAAADVLAGINPGARITYFEKAGEGGNIPLRKNLFRMERLPEEKEFKPQ